MEYNQKSNKILIEEIIDGFVLVLEIISDMPVLSFSNELTGQTFMEMEGKYNLISFELIFKDNKPRGEIELKGIVMYCEFNLDKMCTKSYPVRPYIIEKEIKY